MPYERKIQIKLCYLLKENAFFITNIVLGQTSEKMYHFGGMYPVSQLPEPRYFSSGALLFYGCNLKSRMPLKIRYTAEP